MILNVGNKMLESFENKKCRVYKVAKMKICYNKIFRDNRSCGSQTQSMRNDL